jgi:hypothetical protein
MKEKIYISIFLLLGSFSSFSQNLSLFGAYSSSTINEFKHFRGVGTKFNYPFTEKYSQEIGVVMGYANYVSSGYSLPVFTNCISLRTNAVFYLIKTDKIILNGGPGLDVNFFSPTAGGINGTKMGIDLIASVQRVNILKTSFGVFISVRPQIMPFTSRILDAYAPFHFQRIVLMEINSGISYNFKN